MVVTLCDDRIRLLHLLPHVASTGTAGPILDVLVTAIAFGAGTEGTNSVTKYLGYLKDARRDALASIAVVPPSSNVSQAATIQFQSVITNSDNRGVTWLVFQSDGGSIDESGKYTAPGRPGVFQVAAISKNDASKLAVATVKVT